MGSKPAKGSAGQASPADVVCGSKRAKLADVQAITTQTPMSEITAKLGPPDLHAGSALHQPMWDCSDGSRFRVMIKSEAPDMKPLSVGFVR